MPVMKLTRRAISALAPSEKTLIVYDEDLKGFGLRIMPSGRKSWIVEYRPNGGGRGVAKRRHAIGSFDELTPEAARKAASGLLAGVRLGSDPADARAKGREAVTLRELVDIFLGRAG